MKVGSPGQKRFRRAVGDNNSRNEKKHPAEVDKKFLLLQACHTTPKVDIYGELGQWHPIEK